MKDSAIKVFMLIGVLFAAFPVSAKEAAPKASPKIDIPCIQNAIEERDGSLANMIDVWSSSTKNALEARRGALKDSWDIAGYKDRRFVQRKAWSDYGKVLRSANTEKRKARTHIWKKFENNRQECEGAYSPEMKTVSTYDANL
ncbi:MAG: hypothetical protein ACREUM_03995 [Nitrosospira sp.]